MKRVIVKRGPVQIVCVILLSPILLVMGLLMLLGWMVEQAMYVFGFMEEDDDDE